MLAGVRSQSRSGCGTHVISTRPGGGATKGHHAKAEADLNTREEEEEEGAKRRQRAIGGRNVIIETGVWGTGAEGGSWSIIWTLGLLQL